MGWDAERSPHCIVFVFLSFNALIIYPMDIHTEGRRATIYLTNESYTNIIKIPNDELRTHATKSHPS